MNEQIKQEIENWIAMEELPTRYGLKVIKGFDLYEGMNNDDEEIEAYHDFRNWYMNREYELIMTIPKTSCSHDCWAEVDDSISYAYGSMDFERLKQPFQKYQYKLKMIFERLKDIAQTYSCISNKDGKQNTYQKFKTMVEKEFKDQAEMLINTLKKYPAWVNRTKLMKKVADLNNKISQCNKIWEENAYHE